MSDETAKAVQEVAKTTTVAINAAEKAGGFLAEFIRGPLSEAVGIWTDNLRVRRFENLLSLRARVMKSIEAAGAEIDLRQIPLSIGVPLLEAASLEEDELLQEKWANLLIKFADASSGVSMQKAFGSVLAAMSPLEAMILDKIYSLAPPAPGEEPGILTEQLPESATRMPSGTGGRPPDPSEEVQLAISNLLRLGCLGPATVFDGGELLSVVYESAFGRALHRACSGE